MKKIVRKTTAAVMTLSMLIALAVAPGMAQNNDSGRPASIHAFTAISPHKAVKEMNPGWNLGNTMDAVPYEGAWNNKPVEPQTFDDVKQAGFRSVRIPMNWDAHIGAAPDYTISAAWLDRTEQVVDWALERDLYVMMNVHHDNWIWVTKMAIDPSSGKYVSNFNANMDKLEKVWRQIAERFKGKSAKLIFEILNEPDEGTHQAKNEYPDDPFNPAVRNDLTPEQNNAMMFRMLHAIRDTGGNNKQRLVVIGGIGDNDEQAVEHLPVPADPYTIATFHWYTPWDFVSNWWGRTTWGTDSDKAEVERHFKAVYDKFVKNGVPVTIGEFGTVADIDRQSKAYYYDYVVKTAYKYGMSVFYWDNGNDNLDRETGVWRDELSKNVIVQAGLGRGNSFLFPGDAYVKRGAEIADVSFRVEANGNRLTAVYNGNSRLSEGGDYVYDSKQSTLVLKQSLLQRLVRATALGVNAELRVVFTEGVTQPLRIIHYDTPQLGRQAAEISPGGVADLNIPAQFNGLRLATVKAVYAGNQEPVKEPWAGGYLRMNDDFTTTDEAIRLTAGFLREIRPQSETDITFEFFPRTENGHMEKLEFKLTTTGEVPVPRFTNKVLRVPLEAKVGETVTVRGIINSIDGAEIVDGLIDIEVHGDQGKQFQRVSEGITIKGNETYSIDYSWTPSTPGLYTVKFALFQKNWSEVVFWNDSAHTVVVAE